MHGGTGIGLTNAAGRYLLLNVPAGEHAIVAGRRLSLWFYDRYGRSRAVRGSVPG